MAEYKLTNFITPDYENPIIGLVKLSQDELIKIAVDEGFIESEEKVANLNATDEKRIVVRIMFNHYSSIMYRKPSQNDDKVIIYFHQDGIVSAHKASEEMYEFRCFDDLETVIEYYTDELYYKFDAEANYDFDFYYPTNYKMIMERDKKFDIDLAENISDDEIKTECFDIINTINDCAVFIGVDINNQIGTLFFGFDEKNAFAVYPKKEDCAQITFINHNQMYNMLLKFFNEFYQILE